VWRLDGKRCKASIAAHWAQTTGRSVRRAKLPAAKAMADAVSVNATGGCTRAAYEPVRCSVLPEQTLRWPRTAPAPHHAAQRGELGPRAERT